MLPCGAVADRTAVSLSSSESAAMSSVISPGVPLSLSTPSADTFAVPPAVLMLNRLSRSESTVTVLVVLAAPFNVEATDTSTNEADVSISTSPSENT